MDHVDSDAKQEVWDLIEDIQVAMMTTEGADGMLHSRPMIARQADFDGKLWFFARLGSDKTDEISEEGHVNLAYADPGRNNYVSVSGQARIRRDRDLIHSLWSEPARTWFPKGADDPEICVIEVDVNHAEYWDAPSNAMVMAFGYAKARLTGEPARPGQHGRLDIH
jgi:general stress protein 26